ncbi:ATP-binding protein [Euzebya tangerina]|uniref:ATP-binding protein n=1 Tax=Euzebya tangerina TaxID=591198 RepID=UPI002F2E8DC3
MVRVWNEAAVQLTGYTKEQAIGGPIPTLTPAQIEGMERWLEDWDYWAYSVPVIRPALHADGRLRQVLVSEVVRLDGAQEEGPGLGMFFRQVRPSDIHTHARNVFSGRLAASVRVDDVLEALDAVVADLFPGHRGFFVRGSAVGWEGWLSVGDYHEVAQNLTVASPQVLDFVVDTGVCVDTMITVAGRELDALAVPSGPTKARTVLLLARDTELDDPDEEQWISEIDHELVMALASEAWATLGRVEAVDELEGKVEILEAIAGVAQTAGLDTQAVADHLVRHTSVALSCERAALYLWNDDGSDLELASFHATDMPLPLSEKDHKAGVSAAHDMFDSITPFLTQDTRTCPWLDGPWDHDRGALAVYAMPLGIGDQKVGVLVVAHTTANPRGFTSLCTQVGEAVSRQASLALANAQLFSKQEEATERFKRMDRQRADWIAGVVHDLRSPMTAISGFVDTIIQRGDTLPPDKRDEALDAISRQSTRVNRMLDDMMDSAMAEAGVLSPERQVPLVLADAISDAVVVAAPDDQHRISVEANPDIEVLGDLGQITRVVQNLLVNALHHTPADTDVRITLAEEGDNAVLNVTDRGPGFPEDVDPFSRFGRGSGGGTGLGLYTVKRIVELHRGSIAVHAAAGGGTTLSVTLPLRP